MKLTKRERQEILDKANMKPDWKVAMDAKRKFRESPEGIALKKKKDDERRQQETEDYREMLEAARKFVIDNPYYFPRAFREVVKQVGPLEVARHQFGDTGK